MDGWVTLAERSEYAKQLKRLSTYYQQRHMVKAGMTVWAQITKQTNGLVNDVIQNIECDLYYIKNLAPSLDLFVLLRSIRG